MGYLFFSKFVCLQIVVSRVEDDVFTLRVNNEVAVASANGTIAVHNCTFFEAGNVEGKCDNAAVTITVIASELRVCIRLGQCRRIRDFWNHISHPSCLPIAVLQLQYLNIDILKHTNLVVYNMSVNAQLWAIDAHIYRHVVLSTKSSFSINTTAASWAKFMGNALGAKKIRLQVIAA